MSAATEYPPIVHIPERARRRSDREAVVLAFRARPAVGLAPAPGRGHRLAGVPDLAELPELGTAPAIGAMTGAGTVRDPELRTWRLTRRAYAVLAGLALVLAAALLLLAHASAPKPAAGLPANGAVTVRPGDTLWSIATRVEPQRDPRAVIADLQRRNHLAGATLVPGQVLRVG